MSWRNRARSPRRLGQLGFPEQSSTDETTLQRENLRGLPRICRSLQLSAEKHMCVRNYPRPRKEPSEGIRGNRL